MELHPVAQAVLAVVLGAGVVVVVLWFYAAYRAWMDDAFENARWGWFALLLVFTFPASLISWLIVRMVADRARGGGTASP